MGEGAPRRGSGGGHPRPRPGARTVYSPRWTLGTNSSSQVGGPLARQYRTAQNIWNTWLRISGTHKCNRRRVSTSGVPAFERNTVLCHRHGLASDAVPLAVHKRIRSVVPYMFQVLP